MYINAYGNSFNCAENWQQLVNEKLCIELKIGCKPQKKNVRFKLSAQSMQKLWIMESVISAFRVS